MKLLVNFLITACLFGYVFNAFAAQPPTGDYQDSCNVLSYLNDELNANCPDNNRNIVNSSIRNASTCIGAISNVNGYLVCSGAIGSFAKTCSDIVFEHGKVFAQCRKINGEYSETSIEFRGYKHPISNCDGLLKDSSSC